MPDQQNDQIYKKYLLAIFERHEGIYINWPKWDL